MSEAYSEGLDDLSSYSAEARIVEQDLSSNTPDLNPINEQMIKHWAAYYRNNPDETTKKEMIKRIELMAKDERDEEQKKAIANALQVILRGLEL